MEWKVFDENPIYLKIPELLIFVLPKSKLQIEIQFFHNLAQTYNTCIIMLLKTQQSLPISFHIFDIQFI